MRRLLPLLLILPLMTGCSWLSELLLINSSNETAVVRFTFTDPDCSDCEFHPKAYKVERWSTDSMPYMGDTIALVSRMESDSTWYVELPKGTALVLAQGVNADMRSSEEVSGMLKKMKTLEVLMPNDGTIICHGEECSSRVKHFSRARAGIIFQ
jgi:hypothetical protein